MGKIGRSSYKERRRPSKNHPGSSRNPDKVSLKDIPPAEEKKEMTERFQQASNERGEETERFVCCALILLGKKGAIKRFHRTPKDQRQDKTGIDFVGETNKGCFFIDGRRFLLARGSFRLQAKSSFFGLKIHQQHQNQSRNPKKTPGILRKPGDTMEQVAVRILERLEDKT